MVTHDDINEEWIKVVGRGGPQHESRLAFVRPEAPLLLGDVIYPHRFDILVRSQFMDFCMEFEGLWDESHEEFMEEARFVTLAGISHDIMTVMWNRWRGIPCEWGPHHAAFEMDCTKMVRMARSIRKNGWMPGKGYIQIIKPRTLRPAINGELIIYPFFLGDGQHRTALMHWHGIRVLHVERFEWLDYASYAPWVTTYVLDQAGLVPDNFKELAYGVK